MAMSRTTDWSKKRYIMFVVFFVSELLAVSTGSTKQKRQLFREQLLPHQGGKIPDTAFETQRLILNKFSQNGLYTHDGLYLEQRHPNRQHAHQKYLPNTIKINRPVDNRHVSPPGQYAHGDQVDTTYINLEPVVYMIRPPNFHYSYLPHLPYLSLDLLRGYKYRREQLQHSANGDWNEFTSANEIFKEFAPHLTNSLHEND